jgi:hypothetical protein
LRALVWVSLRISHCVCQFTFRLEHRYHPLSKSVRPLLDACSCDVPLSDDLGESLDMLRTALVNCRLKIGAELSSVAQFQQIAPGKQNILKRHTVLVVKNLRHGHLDLNETRNERLPWQSTHIHVLAPPLLHVVSQTLKPFGVPLNSVRKFSSAHSLLFELELKSRVASVIPPVVVAKAQEELSDMRRSLAQFFAFGPEPRCAFPQFTYINARHSLSPH